jgi:glycosyltransferase involved in cell wall biosynthesis
MTLLWAIEFEYSNRLHHGALMRFVNYSRELRGMGHRVFFAVLLEEKDPGPSRAWFEELIENGTISGYFELQYQPPESARRRAARLIHPALGNRVLGPHRRGVVDAVATILRENKVDAMITSKRNLFFLADALTDARFKILDFGDSEALYLSRDAKSLFRERRWGQLARKMLSLVRSAIEERYYARRSSAVIVVSPVDKMAVDRISGIKSRVLLNGVALPAGASVAKIPNRLIFSGNMNFPPNQGAALWFIENVLPRVRKEVPGAHLVIAGANPPADLRALEGEAIHITGFVDDMNREIALSALYVAPLISGGGFKNKVVEALANRTYVVATPMAVEFLDAQARERVAVTTSPEEMAELIIGILRDPARCEEQLAFLYDYVRANFTWAGQAKELLKTIAGAA